MGHATVAPAERFPQSGIFGDQWNAVSRPVSQMFSLAACKAAQYSVVHSLHKEFEPKGVHCGLIVVGGRVNDESKVTNARNVAEETWKLYDQQKGQGDLDVVMLDPDCLSHNKSREQAK